MADIRINALATTAASTASDDFIAVDGSANGTRKLNAYSPTFGGNLTVSGTGTVSGDLTSNSIVRSAGATNTIRVRGNSQYIDFTNLAENAYVNGIVIANTLNLFGNNGTGLTIGTTGNATLAGNLTVSGTGTSSVAGNMSVGKSTISTWDTVKALEIGDTLGNSINSGGGTDIRIGANAYYQGGWKYAQTFPSTYYQQYNGVHSWHNAPLGTINTAITFSQPMTLTASGNLLVGTTTDAGYTIVARNSDASVAAMSADASSQLRLNAQSGLAILETVTNTPLRVRIFSSEVMRLGTNGNLLLGTTTDNGNKLRIASGSINLDDTYTLGWGNGTAYVQGSVAGNFVKLGTAGSVALTLDSSQRCILAGALRLNNAYTAGAPTATGYVTLQDSAGNTYKVLVGT
jgi:hypothetical protein